MDWIKGAASKVDGFLRKTKILSKISSKFVGNPYGLAANTALSAIGYGRRGLGLKRAGSGRRGRGLTRSGMGRILILIYPNIIRKCPISLIYLILF